LNAGNDDDCDAALDDGVVDDAGPDGPLTAGNGELLGDGAPPDTGGNWLCARAAPIGAASAAVSTTGTRSPRAITIISLYGLRFYDQGSGLTTRRFRQERGATPR
jgi:hypothetical protein